MILFSPLLHHFDYGRDCGRGRDHVRDCGHAYDRVGGHANHHSYRVI